MVQEAEPFVGALKASFGGEGRAGLGNQEALASFNEINEASQSWRQNKVTMEEMGEVHLIHTLHFMPFAHGAAILSSWAGPATKT